MEPIEVFNEIVAARARLGFVERATPTSADLAAIRSHRTDEWMMVIAESERQHRESTDPDSLRKAYRYFNPVVLGRPKNFDRVLRWAQERSALPPKTRDVGGVLYEHIRGTWMIVGERESNEG